jgi:type II secretory pathway pseudopilin PulG
VNIRLQNSSRRRGISLMEVLISMFVLAIGLLGVAALIPAGRHEIVEATKLETAAMVGRNAFRDLQTRGYLNPNRWVNSGGTNVYTPTSATPFTVNTGASDQVAYAIDPLGLTAPAGNYPPQFPFPATGTTPPPLLRIAPSAPSSNAHACFDTIFRSSVDLSTSQNKTNKDLPPNQEFYRDPTTDAPLRRQSVGNYSWLATITSDPSRSAISGDVNVAVAVFYKRDMSKAGAGEQDLESTAYTFPLETDMYPGGDKDVRMVRMPSGGEVEIRDLPNDASGKLKALKPGQWIMFAGSREESNPPTPVKQLNFYRWYRVLSAAKPAENIDGVMTQLVTLAGQDWQVNAGQTKVWIFDNIVSVYEKSLPLELE